MGLSSSSPDSASLLAGTTGLVVFRLVPGTRRRVGFLEGSLPRPDVSLSLSLSLSWSLESGARLSSSCSWSSAVACGFPPTVRSNGGAFLLRPTIILHLAHLYSTTIALRRSFSVYRDMTRCGTPSHSVPFRANPSRSSLTCTFLRTYPSLKHVLVIVLIVYACLFLYLVVLPLASANHQMGIVKMLQKFIKASILPGSHISTLLLHPLPFPR